MSNADTHRRLHELFNERDWDSMDEYVRQDIRYEDSARGQTMKSLTAFKDWDREWAAAFSDGQVAEAEYLDGGDFTVARFVGRGTNDGQMGTWEPTGRRTELSFCEIIHWNASGMAASGAIYYDQMTMLTQLGLASMP